MPCEWYKTDDGIVVHVNRPRSKKRLRCKFCGDTYAEGKLCDFPMGNGKTCDAQTCPRCATTLRTQRTSAGNGLTRLNDTFDVCPIHKGRQLPAEPA